MGLYAREVRPRLLDAALGAGTAAAARRRATAGLAGDVLELGYGSGLNQPHLPPQVSGVWAVEPSARAWGLSAQRRAASSVPVVLLGGDGAAVPAPSGRFDAALCTWTLCSVPDAAAVLREVARVLRPGGALHLVEHGLSPDGAVARQQRRGNGLSRRLCGCVLDRDVRALLEGSPLRVISLEAHEERVRPRAAAHTYEGRAAA